MEMRGEAPGHAKVTGDLEAAKEGKIYLGFSFQKTLLPPPVPSSAAKSFSVFSSYPPLFFFDFNFHPELKDLRSTVKDLRFSHSSYHSSLQDPINKIDELILRV